MDAVQRILERMAARKAEGKNQTYPQHAKQAAPGKLDLSRYSLPVLCKFRGDDTGETRQCPSCTGTVKVKLFACEVHGQCTLTKLVSGVMCCLICKDRVEPS